MNNIESIFKRLEEQNNDQRKTNQMFRKGNIRLNKAQQKVFLSNRNIRNSKRV